MLSGCVGSLVQTLYLQMRFQVFSIALCGPFLEVQQHIYLMSFSLRAEECFSPSFLDIDLISSCSFIPLLSFYLSWTPFEQHVLRLPCLNYIEDCFPELNASFIPIDFQMWTWVIVMSKHMAGARDCCPKR